MTISNLNHFKQFIINELDKAGKPYNYINVKCGWAMVHRFLNHPTYDPFSDKFFKMIKAIRYGLFINGNYIKTIDDFRHFIRQYIDD